MSEVAVSVSVALPKATAPAVAVAVPPPEADPVVVPPAAPETPTTPTPETTLDQLMAEVADEEPIRKVGLESLEGGITKTPVEPKLSTEAPPKKSRRHKLKAKDSSDKVIG